MRMRDLTGAQHALDQPGVLVPRQIGFLAQQAAEKALKGALTFARITDVGTTHNLDQLIATLPDDGSWTIRRRYTDLSSLTRLAAQARYLINEEPVTLEQAQRAYSLATNVYRACLVDLQAHGFHELPGA